MIAAQHTAKEQETHAASIDAETKVVLTNPDASLVLAVLQQRSQSQGAGIVLSEAESAGVRDAIKNPPPPTEKLRARLAERHRLRDSRL